MYLWKWKGNHYIHKSLRASALGYIKDCFNRICESNEYFGAELIIIKSYSVFPALHTIFYLQLSDENLFKQSYCDARNLDDILIVFVLFYVSFI